MLHETSYLIENIPNIHICIPLKTNYSETKCNMPIYATALSLYPWKIAVQNFSGATVTILNSQSTNAT